MIFCAWVDSCLPCQELLIPPLKRFPFILKVTACSAGTEACAAKEVNAKGDEPGSPREPQGPRVAAHPGKQSQLLRLLPNLFLDLSAFAVSVLGLLSRPGISSQTSRYYVTVISRHNIRQRAGLQAHLSLQILMSPHLRPYTSI